MFELNVVKTSIKLKKTVRLKIYITFEQIDKHYF